MNWKYSSLGVRSLAKAVSEMPRSPDMLAAMKPETRAALDNPSSARWHDGMVVIDCTRGVEAIAGLQGVEDMALLAMKKSLGPVVEPFLRVSLALFGASPATVYRRMNDSLGTVMQNVTVKWESTDERSGRLSIQHPDEVPAVSWASWRGSLRYVFEISGVKNGALVDRKDLASSTQLVFDVSWA